MHIRVLIGTQIHVFIETNIQLHIYVYKKSPCNIIKCAATALIKWTHAQICIHIHVQTHLRIQVHLHCIHIQRKIHIQTLIRIHVPHLAYLYHAVCCTTLYRFRTIYVISYLSNYCCFQDCNFRVSVKTNQFYKIKIFNLWYSNTIALPSLKLHLVISLMFQLPSIYYLESKIRCYL